MNFLIRTNSFVRANIASLEDDITKNCPSLTCIVNDGDQDLICTTLVCGVNNEGGCAVLECVIN